MATNLWAYRRHTFEKTIKLLHPEVFRDEFRVVKRLFLTDSGLPAVLAFNTMFENPIAYLCLGHEGQPFRKDDEFTDSVSMVVHGGITFTSFDREFVSLPDKHVWIGWDYAHGGDYSPLAEPNGRVHSDDKVIHDIEEASIYITKRYKRVIPIT